MAVVAAIGSSGFAVNQVQLAAKPPGVTGTVTFQAARNTDPRARQFLDDVQRGEYSWLSMPGTFVEGTIHWHLPHRLHRGACQLAVRTLPEAPGRLGAVSTGTVGEVVMGDDFVLKRAFQEPGPANALGSLNYMMQAADTDGTLTFVLGYPDQQKIPFDDAAAGASAVVECENHADLFNQTRDIAGPVATLLVSDPASASVPHQ